MIDTNIKIFSPRKGSFFPPSQALPKPEHELSIVEALDELQVCMVQLESLQVKIDRLESEVTSAQIRVAALMRRLQA